MRIGFCVFISQRGDFLASDYTRFRQRHQSFRKALAHLEEQSTRVEFSPVEVSGTLHFFAITFELAWKMLKDYMEVQDGVFVASPKRVIKQAFAFEYIQDGDLWMDMLDDRNRVAHVYDEAFALFLMKRVLKMYLEPLKKLGDDLCLD